MPVIRPAPARRTGSERRAINQGYDGDHAPGAGQRRGEDRPGAVPGPRWPNTRSASRPRSTSRPTASPPSSRCCCCTPAASAITTALTGNWSADAFRTTGQSVNDTNTAAQIGTLAGVPTALFSTAAELANYPAAGQVLDFQLPVPNGSYSMTLYFADPAANAAGQRVFNIIANGQTLQANYDIYAAAAAQYAGDGSHAVALTLSVTVTGGNGLDLDLAYVSGFGGPLVNGIALQQANPGGTASPTATVQVSTDDGTTWTTIASSVPVNAYGQGQYVWTVNQTSNGNAALVRVIANTTTAFRSHSCWPTAATTTTSTTAPRPATKYTTQTGNDANSGKSARPAAGQPWPPLLRAYPIGPGANIYVDAGTYNLISNINLPVADSGTATQPVVITGPTDGAPAILNRGNTRHRHRRLQSGRHQQHHHPEPFDHRRL